MDQPSEEASSCTTRCRKSTRGTYATATGTAPDISIPMYKIKEAEQRQTFAGQHPDLQKLCVVNCDTGRRVIPNSSTTSRLDNDYFSGEVMIMIRTPDCDGGSSTRTETIMMGETPRRISEYFKSKQRRFEFQYRIKLKKIPTGPLFLGCEVAHPIEVSRFTKGLAGVLLAMIRRMHSGFHYSWGTDSSSSAEDIEKGRYEQSHLSFPVEATMDRIVITKPGETPPELGHEQHESSESIKHRKRMGAGSIDWNLEDTYTFCLWSAYMDWIQWKTINLIGIRPFSLCSIVQKQPIYLTVYELASCTPQEYKKKRPPHHRQDMCVYTRLELSNSDDKTEGGLALGIRDCDDTESASSSDLATAAK